jgi:anion-transporting  ArsA/GET3 family ATPase
VTSVATGQAPAGDGSRTERLVGDKALLFVSGKGGAGKTTVAATLAVAAARRDRRTIICELAGAENVARAFGAPSGARGEIRHTRNLWSLSLDTREALREWMRRQPGGKVAAGVLGRSPAFEHFVAAAPGAKELIAIGKVLDLAGRAPDHVRPDPYELVVVDAPSTGHAVGMVAAPGAISEAASVGPVGTQAGALRDVLTDPQVTGYVGVSLPEEMSVVEVLELERRLCEVIGRGLDLIVVNGVHPDRFTDEEARRLAELAARPDAPGALHAALMAHRRARRHAAHVSRLQERTRTPVVTLPYLFVPTVGPREYEALALELGRPDEVEEPASSPRRHGEGTDRRRCDDPGGWGPRAVASRNSRW